MKLFLGDFETPRRKQALHHLLQLLFRSDCLQHLMEDVGVYVPSVLLPAFEIRAIFRFLPSALAGSG
jgi:hypothetical protein